MGHQKRNGLSSEYHLLWIRKYSNKCSSSSSPFRLLEIAIRVTSRINYAKYARGRVCYITISKAVKFFNKKLF